MVVRVTFGTCYVHLFNLCTEPDAQVREKAEAQKQLANLKQQLEASQSKTNDARKEAELTLLQLHKVQVELE